MPEKKEKEPVNPAVAVDEHVEEMLNSLQLLDLEELIVTLTVFNQDHDILPTTDLVRAFSQAINSGESETVALLSIWTKRYKTFLNQNDRITAENVDEGIKFYESDLKSAINRSRR